MALLFHMMFVKLVYCNFVFDPGDEVSDVGENFRVFRHAASNVERRQPDHLKDSIISLYGQRTSGVALDENGDF